MRRTGLVPLLSLTALANAQAHRVTAILDGVVRDGTAHAPIVSGGTCGTIAIWTIRSA